MAKVAIKSEKLTPFGGIFSIMEQFDSMLSPIIDQTLGQRCRSIIGYQYSEIIRSLMSVYFCGGSCVEDVTSHLMRHLSYHPTLRTCSSDTIRNTMLTLTISSLKQRSMMQNRPTKSFSATGLAYLSLVIRLPILRTVMATRTYASIRQTPIKDSSRSWIPRIFM